MNRKVEPRPGADSTQMRPACSSMILREIARPRPVPPLVRVVEPSSCRNSSNTRSRSSGAIPGPVSATATSNAPLAAATLTATSPSSVNLIALPTRLSSTCVIRRSSPWPRGRPSCSETLSDSPFSAASAPVAVTTRSTISGIA